MSTPVSQDDKQAALARLNRFSQVADNAIVIPFTRFRIGLEPIIGLVRSEEHTSELQSLE